MTKALTTARKLASRKRLSLAEPKPPVSDRTVSQLNTELDNLERSESAIGRIRLPEHPDLQAKLKTVIKQVSSAATILEDVAAEAEALNLDA